MKRLWIVLAMMVLLTACGAPKLAENPYGPEDFIYKEDYLTCTAGESRLGVDVSSHQGVIDWQAVADSGVEFAMIRIGFRGYLEGEINADTMARANIEGAKAAGLDVGVYFFSQALTREEAAREAAWCVTFLENTELEMPLVFDWEYMGDNVRTSKMDSRTLTDMAKAFCDTIRAAGYEPMLYFGRSQSEEMMNLEELTDYPFWLAMYSTIMDYPYKIHMWQYTDQGTVPGIAGNVDLNLWFNYE